MELLIRGTLAAAFSFIAIYYIARSWREDREAHLAVFVLESVLGGALLGIAFSMMVVPA